jgi:hypothetical protein
MRCLPLAVWLSLFLVGSSQEPGVNKLLVLQQRLGLRDGGVAAFEWLRAAVLGPPAPDRPVPLRQLEATCAVALTSANSGDGVGAGCFLAVAGLANMDDDRIRRQIPSTCQGAAHHLAGWFDVVKRLRSVLDLSEPPPLDLARLDAASFHLPMQSSQAAQCVTALASVLDNLGEESLARDVLLTPWFPAEAEPMESAALVGEAAMMTLRAGRDTEALELFEKADKLWGLWELDCASTHPVDGDGRPLCRDRTKRALSNAVRLALLYCRTVRIPDCRVGEAPEWSLFLSPEELSAGTPELERLRMRGYSKLVAGWAKALMDLGADTHARSRLRAAVVLDPTATSSLINAGAVALSLRSPVEAAVMNLQVMAVDLQTCSQGGHHTPLLGQCGLLALRNWLAFGAGSARRLHGQAAESLPAMQASQHGMDAAKNLAVGTVTFHGSLIAASQVFYHACREASSSRRACDNIRRKLRQFMRSEGQAGLDLFFAAFTANGRQANLEAFPGLLGQVLRGRRLTQQWRYWDRETAAVHRALGVVRAGERNDEMSQWRRCLACVRNRTMCPEPARFFEAFDSMLLPFSPQERLVVARATSLDPIDTPLFNATCEASPGCSGGFLCEASQAFLLPWVSPPPNLPVSQFHCHVNGPPDAVPVVPVQEQGGVKALRVLYVSHDFSAHPTATMIEGLIASHTCRHGGEWTSPLVQTPPRASLPARTRCVTPSALHYGTMDGSRIQQSLAVSFQPFLFLSGLTDSQALQHGRSLGPHIALDMQGPTLSTRENLFRQRIAPVQALYLIFPGTSGRRFYDYFIADRSVVPAELADRRFQEKIAFMPRTYQANYWTPEEANMADQKASLAVPETGSVSSSPWELVADPPAWKRNLESKMARDLQICAGNGKKPGDVVFATFNKLEKLNPLTLATWCHLLRRVPRSVLWLLAPVETGNASLARAEHELPQSVYPALAAQFRARGVAPSRVILAPRCGKEAHLLRLQRADLFLDTVSSYGAHSTATDALRAGLPVLSNAPAWGQMPERVAASMLQALDRSLSTALLGVSLKDFEDLAPQVVKAIVPLRQRVIDAVHRGVEPGGPLSVGTYTEDMERTQALMWEVFVQRRSAHIVVGAM